jgi:hypothetical protein
VQVSGGTAKQRMLFYSTLFQSFASPRLVARKGENFTDTNGQTQTAAYDRYGPVPFWDTGRNQIVLLELLEPEATVNIMRSELDMARERGFMNTSFHGDNAVFLYLGAMRRGIPFDYEAAYTFLRKNATDPAGPAPFLPNMTSRAGSLTRSRRATPALLMQAARRAPPPRWNMRGTMRRWRSLPASLAIALMRQCSPSAHRITAMSSTRRSASCVAAPPTANGSLPLIHASPITTS